MLLPHMVVKGKVGSIPVQFYCLSLHIKSIEIACGISDVWAGSMYWLSSKWSEQIWYELYNCFAVFEPRSPGLVSGFAIRLRHSPWANFEVDWRNPKIRFRQSGERVYRQKYESTYTASAFRVYLYDFDVYIQLGNNERY